MWYYSVISEIELLGLTGLPTAEEKALKALLKDCMPVEINSDIREISIRIKQQKKIKIPDAIIVATALWLEFPLVTADKGFKNIPGIDLILMG